MTIPRIPRSSPEPRSDSLDYREELRADFWFSCGYCGISESEGQGIGFEIDHYLPHEHFPRLKNTYKNLIYSCRVCNRYKSDFSPTSGEFPKGLFLYRPDRNPEPKYRIEEKKLEGTNPLDNFNIEKLFLNREPLQKLRELREQFAQANEYLIHGARALQGKKLDDFSRQMKGKLLELKKIAKALVASSEMVFEEFVKEFCHSPLLDEDPNLKEKLKIRRENLEKQKALVPSGQN